MEKIAQMALLVDFYGPLLTDKQRNVWDFHYQQDLSLAEIAEIENTSRQAVHDLLKRTEKLLSEYEEKLGLIKRFWAEKEKLQEAERLLQELNASDFANNFAWERFSKAHSKVHEVFLDVAENIE